MPPTLSKSTFIRGKQCQKSLYLNWHQPELKAVVSPMQQAIFNQGHEVGKLARQLFPGGVDAGIYVREWGIGLRIEDNVLVTADGCENLSAAIPSTIEEIENIMANKKE